MKIFQISLNAAFRFYVELKRKYFEELWRIKQMLVPIDFHSRERNTIEVNRDHKLFDYQHSSNIFYVQQQKETRTGLEQHEGE